MLSYIDSARAGALDAGHAYAAGGRRAPEAENGVLMGGTKADASQRFDDFPGEQPSQGEIERWVRNARSKMTDDQKAVVRNAVPAKLLAETSVSMTRYARTKEKCSQVPNSRGGSRLLRPAQAVLNP